MDYNDFGIDDNDDNDELVLGKEFTDNFKGLISEWDEMYKNMTEEEIKKHIEDEKNNNIVTVDSFDDLLTDKEEEEIKQLAEICEDDVYKIIISQLINNIESNKIGDRLVQCYDFDYAENISLNTGFDKYHQEKYKQYNETHNNKACYFDDVKNGRRYVFLFDDLKDTLEEHGIEMNKIDGSTDNHSGIFKCTTDSNNLEHLKSWLEYLNDEEDVIENADIIQNNQIAIENNNENTYDNPAEEYVKNLTDECKDEVFEFLIGTIIKNVGSSTYNDTLSRGFAYHYGEMDKPVNLNDKYRVDMFNSYNRTHDNKGCYFLDNIKFKRQFFLLDDLIESLKEHGIETEINKEHGFSNGTIRLTTDLNNLDNLTEWYNELSGEDYRPRSR
jgi:hypothetical protein